MRTLAIDCSSFRDVSGLPAVFGKDVAVRGIADALVRYGNYDRYVLLHPPSAAADTLEPLRAHLRPGAAMDIEMTAHIPRILERGEITAWFQPDAVTEPVNFRTLFARSPFPFTNLIHVAGYPSLVRTQFLWLLLDGFASCDSCICTSRALRTVVCETLEYIAEELTRCTGATVRFRGRLDVLPLGVDTARFAPRPRQEVRASLGLRPDAFVILWFGRFSAIDKADLLPALRMFRRLVRANPGKSLTFVLAGNDRRDVPFVPSIREFVTALGIAEHVRILDDASADRRHEMFAAADVFTSPVDNVQETFGLTPLEAMATGIPQVVSDWDGYRDTIVDGVTGFRIPTYWARLEGEPSLDYGLGGFGYQGFLWSQTVAVDLRAYQSAMQRLIDDPSLVEAMRVASRKRAVAVYDWQAVVPEYEALWEELAAIASRATPEDFPAAPLMRACMGRRFASFPTAVLDESQRVTISDDGARLLSRLDPFPWHAPAERSLMETDAIDAMLDSVSRGPGTLCDVAARLARTPADHPKALRMLMWGIKHGLLDCGGPAPAEGRA